MKKQFLVTVDIPKGVTITEMKDYLRVSIMRWGRGYDIDDPLFKMGSTEVSIKTVKDVR